MTARSSTAPTVTHRDQVEVATVVHHPSRVNDRVREPPTRSDYYLPESAATLSGPGWRRLCCLHRVETKWRPQDLPTASNRRERLPGAASDLLILGTAQVIEVLNLP